MSNAVKVAEHVVSVYYDPNRGKFFTDAEGYVFEADTLAAVRDKIDAYEKRSATAKRGEMSRSVFLCDEAKLEPFVLRGINANDASFKVEVDGRKDKRTPGYDAVLVDRDHTLAGTLLELYEAFAAQQAVADKAQAVYWKAAQKIGVKARNGYGRRLDSSEAAASEEHIGKTLDASLGENQ